MNEVLHLIFNRNCACILPNPLTTLHLYKPASVKCARWIFNKNRLIIKFGGDHIGSKSSLFFDHWIDKSGVLVTGQFNSMGLFSFTSNVIKFDTFGKRDGGPKNHRFYDKNITKYSLIRITRLKNNRNIQLLPRHFFVTKINQNFYVY
jgi:hypothetical protein